MVSGDMVAISDSETKYLKLKPLGFQKDNFKKVRDKAV